MVKALGMTSLKSIGCGRMLSGSPNHHDHAHHALPGWCARPCLESTSAPRPKRGAYTMNDIPTMNPNEGGDNKSSNESNYFIDETSTFETDMVFNSRQDLIDWVQNVGRGIGYVIVIKNSRRNYNVVFQCDRGGVYRSTKIFTRNTGTKKINCPFKLEGIYTAADNS
ncbi:hypothetical protein LXL04_016628 [Taraxacum kok-saghyz]